MVFSIKGLLWISLAVLSLQACSLGSLLAAEGDDNEDACPDKSQYTLFNPTPAKCMREFDPDRPDITDSPFTIDAGHIQFETVSSATPFQGQTSKALLRKSSILPTRISGLGSPTTRRSACSFRPSTSCTRGFQFPGSTHGSRGPVRSSFTPNSISSETTALRSRARWPLVCFQD